MGDTPVRPLGKTTEAHLASDASGLVQGYLAHKKTPTPLGHP